MAGFIKGITIEFGADVSKLNDALKDTQTAVSRTQTELKQIDRALKFNPGNTTLLKQKFDVLKQAVTQTDEKLKGLKNLQAEMKAKGVDENSAAYRELEREIIKTEDQLKQAEKELKQFGSVGKQQCIAVGEEFKKVGSKISSVGQTMTMNVTTPLVAGFTASAKYASDLDENMNKLDVAFGSNAEAVKAWAKTAGEQFGMSQVAATDAASAFGALGKGIGLSEKESADMSTTLAGLSADLGSYFNVGLDESAKALEGIFTGESEALKKFGVVMTDTNLKQFAEDQGLVYSELSQTEKTQLRYNYVLEKTKDAQGDFSRTSDGTANSIKVFQAAIQDLASTVGAVLLPIITPIIQKLASLIQKFGELSPTAQKIIVVMGIIAAAIGPVLVVIGGLISAIGAIITIAPVLGTAFAALAGPVGVVIAILGAVVAAGLAVYKNWNTIKKYATKVWGAIKSFLQKTIIAIVTAFKVKFMAVKTFITTVFTAIRTKITSVWTNIKTKISNTVTGIKDKITTTFTSLKEKVGNTFKSIKEKITKPISDAKNKVSEIVDKIKDFFPISLKKIVSFSLPKIDIGTKSTKVGDKSVKSPTFGVGGWKHYAKAMNQPYMFTRATGIVAGEAGDEILYGRNSLMRDIAQAVGGGGGITVNVYGSDGMSVTELANAVERKLIQAQKRRTEAWA
jgi:phage-related minor tail protein